ncbi:Uncharacterised protein [uncultured archaeon]|nr:Uncharacterised protein [uncultured archaeon]
MTYSLSATKKQDGHATVRGRFAYEENIFFPHYEPGKDKEWQEAAKKINKRRDARQSAVKDAIKQFLESQYNAKGLKDFGTIGNMGFVLTNHNSRNERGYHATENGTTYDVEVSGTLASGEHLEDMLDCEALDTQLKQIFGEMQ